MRKRKLRFLVALVLPIALLAAYFLCRPTEPSYRSRPLKVWISAYREESEESDLIYRDRKLSDWVLETTQGPNSQRGRALLTILAYGTNGIPYYLEWTRYKPGFFKSAKFKCAELTREWLHINWVPDDLKMKRVLGASSALACLGPLARDWIPQIMEDVTNAQGRISHYYRVPGTPCCAITELAGIGRRALPAYLSLLTNPEPRIRVLGLENSHGFFGSTAAVEQIRYSFKDSDPTVRLAATNALRRYENGFGGPIKKL